MIHTFTQSGLGEAPFSICHPNDPKARENTAFFCEHCGTAIKNRYFVKSRDGKVSVVGIDCLKKTGDQGLIDGEKRLRQNLRAEAREAANEARQAKADEEDRQRFGGKTREEVVADLRAEIEALEAEHEIAVDEHPATSVLNRHGFEIAMTNIAYSGKPFSKGQQNTMAVAIARKKSGGARKNSKAFNAVLPEAKALVASYQALVEAHAGKVEAIHSRILDLLNNR